MSFYMKMKYLQNLQIDGNKKESNGTWEAREKNIPCIFMVKLGIDSEIEIDRCH